MPIFLYQAKKGPTELVNGEIEAESQSVVVGLLDQMGLAPVSVTEKQAQGAAKAERGATANATPSLPLFRRLR